MAPGPRMQIERDRVQILGGVMAGETTGAPLALLVENRDHVKWKGQAVPSMTAPRPGHADLTGALKYGYRDLRPALERASARETAARVAGGAICKHFLSELGIQIGGYVIAIGEVEAELGGMPYEQRFVLAEASEVRCPDQEAGERMQRRIREIMQAKDTLGGVIEVVALGVPAGLGSYVHWERRLEARLGAALLSVPAIKGWRSAGVPKRPAAGTQAQDPILLDGEELNRPTALSAGWKAGSARGDAGVAGGDETDRTTLTPQTTVDLATGEQSSTRYERSDFCPVPRAVCAGGDDSFRAGGGFAGEAGGDSMEEIRPRLAALRKARLSDLVMDNQEHVYWPEEGTPEA